MSEQLIGAHTSIAKKIYNYLIEGKKIGANAIQMFSANQRQWFAKPLDQNDVKIFLELKEEWNEKMIMQLNDQVEVLEETQDILKEEIKITSAMLQDGTEADGKFEELQRQLEELENKKPKTRVIVKEIKVDKKGRKL